MSELPGDLKYMKSHEWARAGEDGLVRVGITDHAQSLLGDLVYVELPEVGSRVEADAAHAVVESVKAASDVYSPVSGEVTAVNESLDDSPEQVNEAPYGNGWLFEVKADDPAALDRLMSAEAYGALIED